MVCGHIHQPAMREVKGKNGRVTYLNSGDWMENLTALEWHCGQWRIYRHQEEQQLTTLSKTTTIEEIPDTNQLFR